ncbi:MAG: RNA repair transcriptional activator RtcR [Acidobacteriota bacterium]
MTRTRPSISPSINSERRTVVFGILGVTLDAAALDTRWRRWRPTVALGMQDDLIVDRLELWYDPSASSLLELVQGDLAAVSPETEVVPRPLPLKDPWDFEEVYAALLDGAVGYDFTPETEDYLLHITTGSHVWQICLFLLAEAKYFPARLLQTSPRRRQRGPEGEFGIIDLDLSRYDALARRFAEQRRDDLSFLKQGIETRSAAFNALIERIETVALRSREPMLITGPTGAGKSRLAKRIYELKAQRRQVSGRFVEVNCATLRGDAAMSTLFGHRRGAFTGALADRPGLLTAADGGVLFLDEIGELGSDEQAMFLRAIEDGRFLPMGADTEKSSDFQLIAGTNRDLRARVADGSFREDLLARIDLWTFELPGLAERREDIEPNLDYELDRAGRRLGTRVTINREARRRFVGFATSDGARWSANFRDLSAAVTRMATLAPGGRIDRDGVDEEVARLERGWRGAGPTSAAESDLELLRGALGERADALDLFDRVQLAEVIRVCRRSPSLAAAGRELFASSRLERSNPNDTDRVRKYLARFGLTGSSL